MRTHSLDFLRPRCTVYLPAVPRFGSGLRVSARVKSNTHPPPGCAVYRKLWVEGSELGFKRRAQGQGSQARDDLWQRLSTMHETTCFAAGGVCSMQHANTTLNLPCYQPGRITTTNLPCSSLLHTNSAP
jgi:hypothetical protein